LPQQLFEIGDVSWVLPGSMDSGSRQVIQPSGMGSASTIKSVDNTIHNDTNAAEYRHLAACMIGSDIGYASIRPVLEALTRDLGLVLSTPPLDTNSALQTLYIQGRAASIIVGEQSLGHIGEIHPRILEHYKLSHPVALFEIDVELILGLLSST